MAQNKSSKTPAMNPSEEDHTLLIKPINVGLSGPQHILQSIQKGTPEVRNLILNECNVIYECKVCKSLHRSLVNFLAHKRVYCTVHCCESMMLFTQQDIENETVIIQPESPDSGAAINEDDAMGDEPDGTSDAQTEKTTQKEVIVSPTKIFHVSNEKDKSKQKIPSVLTDHNPIKVDGVCNDFLLNCAKHLDNRNANRTQVTLKLEPIEDNRAAMLQRVLPPGAASSEIKLKNTTLVENSNHIEIPQCHNIPVDLAPSELGGVKSYACCKCGSQFSSMKSMSFHLKTIHAKRRIYFHCPYCKSRFSQVYGVNRHMMSVHKKSKEQVGRLRSKIQKSALLRLAAEKDSVEEISDSEDKLNNNHSRSTAKATLQNSPIQDSTVRLAKSLNMHRCPTCDKIFMDKRTLESHTRRCTKTSTNKSSDAKTPPEEKPNDRPRRAVKKKEEGDFVDSSRLNILTNTVASKGDGAIKVPPMVEKKILEIVNVKKLLCVHCNKSFMNLSNLRRHAAGHIGWNRFKCKHCDYQSYSRSDCRSHVKRKHITKRRLHKQLDSFVVDLPVDEVEKTVANGEFKPVAFVEKSGTKGDSDSRDSRSKRAFDSQSSGDEPEADDTKMVTDATATPASANKRLSTQPASFNISTRLSPRTFDTSPYRRSDSESMLVTRSGTYLKTDSRVSSARRELLTPQPDQDNQKVLRTKVIQLKPSPPSPENPSAASNYSCDSETLQENNTCCIFANYDDHNYSVEVKFVKPPELKTEQPDSVMDEDDS